MHDLPPGIAHAAVVQAQELHGARAGAAGPAGTKGIDKYLPQQVPGRDRGDLGEIWARCGRVVGEIYVPTMCLRCAYYVPTMCLQVAAAAGAALRRQDSRQEGAPRCEAEQPEPALAVLELPQPCRAPRGQPRRARQWQPQWRCRQQRRHRPGLRR